MLVPKIRFKEFKNEWHKEKLGKTCSILMCKRIFANQTSNNYEIPFYKIGTIGTEADTCISKKLFDEYKEKYNYPRKGELLVTCAGTVGKCLVFDGKDAYFQDSNIVWIDNPTQVIKNSFLFYLMNNVNWSKLNSTTIVRIYNDNLRNLNLTFPDVQEQAKIAKFLNLLDKKIQLQQRKIETLKMYKRGLINEIFSNIDNYEKVSNVIGFEQPNKYIVNSTNYEYKKTKDNIPVLTANKAFILGYTEEKEGIYNKGACVIFDDFTMESKYVDFEFKIKSSAIKILTAKNNNDIYYLFEALNTKKLISNEHKRHYISIVQNIEIPVTDLSNQSYISKILQRTNKRILVEDEKISNLKILKRGLLQKMFI